MSHATVCVFDLDGTLLDSDEALLAPFLALGVERTAVTFGHVLADECARLGLDVDAYLEHYDPTLARPYAGVEGMLTALPRWAVCSNKHGPTARAELARLGWKPDVGLFADDFGGPKQLGPVLAALGVAAADVVFVGDTAHDRRCAAEAGVRFALAGWNPRARPAPGDIVLRRPADVVSHVVTAVAR